MRNVEIDRGDGQRPLIFEGTRLASVSTANGSVKSRWTEIDLWRTRAGVWVQHVRGCTRVRGEVTLHSATIFTTVEALITGLERNGSISDLGWELLAIAADVDDKLDKALDVYERTPLKLK